ncbi:MAG TPA: carboxypeptidase regulatory-like domain-containing protein, partial [Nocardioidaceae bacterium]|nr:carboxypeptidase regulatory-like domain-containing protein [Nocardioidaceae bacterium]
MTNRAGQPLAMAITVMGLDAGWVPAPVRTATLAPGDFQDVELALRPAHGSVAARYPFTVAVQGIVPDTQAVVTGTALSDTSLLVSTGGRLSVRLTPTASSAVASKRVAVFVTNTGDEPTDVEVTSTSSKQAPLRLRKPQLTVGPGETRRVRGRITVANPRIFGMRTRHAFTITARSAGAPVGAEGAFTQRPFFGPFGTKAIAVVALISMWAALAITFVPKLADTLQARSDAQNATIAGGEGGSGSGDSGGSGAGGSEGSGGSDGSGSGGAGEDGGATQVEQVAAGGGVQLNGVVSGKRPDQVRVSLKPTSLVNEAETQFEPVGYTPPSSLSAVGMVPASASFLDVGATVTQYRSVLTGDDGAWSFPAVSAPGYYLLTFSKPGYDTKRYVVDASSETASEPLDVSMAAGKGSLGGRVTGPKGSLGGAQVTITDGVSTLSTSSATGRSGGGGKGSWSVDGLSTPGSYLVTVTKPGMSTFSYLADLGAGGSKRVDAKLVAGVGSLTGLVEGPDPVTGVAGGLGSATVTATDGEITRTATTVTRGATGRYTLTGLPVPGDYTVTFSAPGYRSLTTKVHLGTGQDRAVKNAQLGPASAVVTGTITDEEGTGLVGAGLTLANKENTYKTMTTSSGNGGGFRFDNVAPGTYVLTTELFGYLTDVVTVQAVAGQNPPPEVNRQLVAQEGGVLPATGHIQGEVTDSRTGGPVTCPEEQPACITATVTDQRPEDPEGQPTTFTTTFPATERYVLPTSEEQGLLPGSHTVRLRAPGYEPAKVVVDVPVGELVTAPPVAMNPLPVVTGRVTPAVGTPATATCVIAIAEGGTSTAPDCVPDQCTGKPDVTKPKQPVCGRVEDKTGFYTLQLPKHGSYDVYVQPSDKEYVPVPGATFKLPVAGTQVYDALIHRMGRIDVLIREPGGAKGELTAAPGAEVTVDGKNPQTTTNDGQVLFTKVEAGDHEVAASKTTDGATITASPRTVPVALDQTVMVNLALTDPIDAILGRVVTNIDGTTQAVPGARIKLTGISGYRDDQPLNKSINLTADDEGCFAVYNDGDPVPDAPAECAGGTWSPTKFTLLSNIISVDISAAGYQTRTPTSEKVATGSLVDFSLQPKGVKFAGTLTTNPTDDSLDLSKARVQITDSAAGTGVLDVEVAADGTLTWNDSHYNQRDVIRPGRYQLSATLDGYQAASASFDCKVSTATDYVCSVGMFELKKLNGVTVEAVAPNPSVDGETIPVAGARFILQQGDKETIRDAGEDVTSAKFTGLVPEATDYDVEVHAAGYQFSRDSMTLTCGEDTTTLDALPAAEPGESLDCTMTLTRSGAITGTVVGTGGDSTVPLVGADVTVAKCTGDPAAGDGTCDPASGTGTHFASTTVADPTDSDTAEFRVTGTRDEEGLTTGFWQVIVTMPGYGSTSKVVEVASLSADTSVGELDLAVKTVNLTVTVYNQKHKKLNDPDLALQLISGPSVTGTPIEATGTGSVFTFTGINPGTYVIAYSGKQIDSGTQQVPVEVGKPEQSFPLTIGLAKNEVSGKITALQGANDAPTALAGATVCLIDAKSKAGCDDDAAVADGTDDGELRVDTGDTGDYMFRTVPHGTYDLVIEAPAGYLSPPRQEDIVFDQTTADYHKDFALTRVTHTVTVTVDLPEGSDRSLDGAK